MANVISDVATGRRINGREKFEETFHALVSRCRVFDRIADVKLEAMRNPVKRQIDDRGRVECENLAEDQTADDGDT